MGKSSDQRVAIGVIDGKTFANSIFGFLIKCKCQLHVQVWIDEKWGTNDITEECSGNKSDQTCRICHNVNLEQKEELKKLER